jgi:SulP family sulfate permease
LIAVVGASVAVWAFGLPVETIGSRFGGIPRDLPMPRLPPLDPALALAVLPSALAFTLLGGVESLLSARVADQMTSRVHRSNMELVAQGLANVGAAAFGGIAVTGTIARTATNIRAGARSPVAGILHALILLAATLLAAPLMAYIPLAALAGVLVVVAWGMVERREAALLLKDGRGAAMLLATFGLTMLYDLTVGILAGCMLSALFLALDRIRRT